jgi:glutamate carboxypeptidase
MNDYIELLAEIVNIDSGTGDMEGLQRIAKILQSRLRKLGMNLQPMEAEDGSVHYFANRGHGKCILMVAHLDTVFTKGTAAKRSFRVTDDIAYGPGVSDCKSGVVTIMAALENLNRMNAWTGREIACFFNTDEEIGSPGSRSILEKLAHGAEAVLVVEPSEGENITITRKGIGRFRLQVFGKAAHSGSDYEVGRNAILELAHKIIAIQELTDLTAGITLNVGVVIGGIRPNIVPDYAEAEIDLRIVYAGQETKVQEQLNRITATSRVNGVMAKLSGGITRPPMPLLPQNETLYQDFANVARSLGMTLDTFHSGGGSDANFTSALGIPTIDGVGPQGGGHHSEAEYLELPSFARRIDLLTEFLRQQH